MAFRNFNDVIRYVRGDWQKENDLIDLKQNEANREGQGLIDNYSYDEDGSFEEDLVKFADRVYELGMLCGARFGMNEVVKILTIPGYKPKA